MANVIVIIGKSGSGKSTSIRTLNPDETCIINCLSKALPFKGSAEKYSVEKKNIVHTTNYQTIVNALQLINTGRPEIKNVIIDDAGYIMNTEMFERAMENGYGKFAAIAHHMYQVLNTAKNCRADLNVVFMFHLEENPIEGSRVERTIKLPGKMISEKFNPVELCTVVAFAHVNFYKDKDEEYVFVVRKTPDYEIAKSPIDMFEDKQIPNDLKYMLETINNYYKS